MGPRRVMFILAAIAFCGLLLGASNESPSAPKEVTFNRDVAPILFKNCVVCHRPNDIAPMSLMTYQDTRPWTRPIRDAVVTRKMPPWHADPKVGDFINDPRLTDAEIATIDSWVRTGAKEGDPKDLPPAPTFVEGWHIKPDVILTIPEFLVTAASMDDYEYIYVPTNFTEDKWIQAAEVLPGDRRVVHHATVSVIAASEVAKKEEENAKSDAGVDKYHYRTSKVLHIRKDAQLRRLFGQIRRGCGRILFRHAQQDHHARGDGPRSRIGNGDYPGCRLARVFFNHRHHCSPDALDYRTHRFVPGTPAAPAIMRLFFFVRGYFSGARSFFGRGGGATVSRCAHVSVAAHAGTEDKKNCCAPQQSRAVSMFRIGNRASLRGHTRDAAAGSSPHDPRHRQNLK